MHAPNRHAAQRQCHEKQIEVVDEPLVGGVLAGIDDLDAEDLGEGDANVSTQKGDGEGQEDNGGIVFLM
jgi:hypothetical protein